MDPFWLGVLVTLAAEGVLFVIAFVAVFAWALVASHL